MILKDSTLFKYRSWNNENHRRILTNQEIYFASPEKFNDPFDCTIPARYDLLTRDETRELYKRHIRRENPHLGREEIRKLVRDWMKKKIYKNHARLRQYQVDFKYKNFGVCTLSAPHDNILMWSHYANAHTGFCIGFDKQLLHEFQNNILDTKGILIDLCQVEYMDKYPELHPSRIPAEELIMKELIIKSSLWRYEEEYRLILSERTNLTLNLTPSLISCVLFGCKMDKKTQNDIKIVLKDYDTKPELYEAHKQKDTFGLYFEKVSY